MRKCVILLVNYVKKLDFVGVLGYSLKVEGWKYVGLIVIWDVLKLRYKDKLEKQEQINSNMGCIETDEWHNVTVRCPINSNMGCIETLH